MNNRITIRELLELPEINKHLAPDTQAKIEKNLTDHNHNSDTIYVRILIGIGAWLSALFFLGAIGGAFHSLGKLPFLICGILLMVAGTILGKASKSLFLSQVSLASVFAGNIITVIMTSQLLDYNADAVFPALVSQLIICTVLYHFYCSSIYRFVSPGAVGVLVLIWLYDSRIHDYVHILIGAEMVLFGVLCFKKKYSPQFAPLKYSVACLLPGTILIMNMFGGGLFYIDKYNTHYWPSSIVLTSGLLLLFYHLAGGMKRLREPWMILTVIATILLGIFANAGILVAIGLLALGYALGDKFLMALSFLFLPCFLVLFYYNMEVDLAYKSVIVAGSGILILAVRWLLGMLKPEEVNA
jgi:hypothetical protein